ncbi:prolyl oligopeptidase family serine peptidase [Haloferula sp.]|uniref:prolyl oligopeptidase family serine peptidase n=1 Tax=Haloferula sp. TaxID=2497595 RepID=UPI00329E8F6D
MKVLSFLLTLILAAVAQARQWTSIDGRKLEAEFVSSSDNKVILKRDADGEVFTLPVDKLSEADREWIEDNKDKPAPTEPPAKMEGPAAELLTGSWVLREEKGLPYTIFGAADLDANKKYPLVISLHGKSNNDVNGKQKQYLKHFEQDARYQKNPAILVAPLCYQPHGGTGGGWSAKPGEQTIDLIEKLVKDLPVDENRIYLLGYSMGGGGTIHLVTSEPKLFAAAIVIAGWASGDASKVFKKVPCWAFHGGKDDVVDPSSIQELAEDLKRVDSFKYTEFPDDGHSVWGKSLNSEATHEWLFSQTKK